MAVTLKISEGKRTVFYSAYLKWGISHPEDLKRGSVHRMGADTTKTFDEM